jgi:hypothetical protein
MILTLLVDLTFMEGHHHISLVTSQIYTKFIDNSAVYKRLKDWKLTKFAAF